MADTSDDISFEVRDDIKRDARISNKARLIAAAVAASATSRDVVRVEYPAGMGVMERRMWINDLAASVRSSANRRGIAVHTRRLDDCLLLWGYIPKGGAK